MRGHASAGKGSINRNIVECKDKSVKRKMVTKWGINRNIVECKASLHGSAALKESVLIETLWNVKYAELSAQDKADKY